MRWSIGLFGMLLAPALAFAHGLGVEYKIDGDVVHVSAYFDNEGDAEAGSDTAGAKVRVLDGERRLVAEGTMDAKGTWGFPRPAAGSYKIEVDAGAGHFRRIPMTISAEPGAATEPPTRKEFTRSRWRELTLGLGIITIAAVGLRRLLRKRETA